MIRSPMRTACYTQQTGQFLFAVAEAHSVVTRKCAKA